MFSTIAMLPANATVDKFVGIVKDFGLGIGICLIVISGCVIAMKRSIPTAIVTILFLIVGIVLIVAPNFITDTAGNLQDAVPSITF